MGGGQEQSRRPCPLWECYAHSGFAGATPENDKNLAEGLSSPREQEDMPTDHPPPRRRGKLRRVKQPFELNCGELGKRVDEPLTKTHM